MVTFRSSRSRAQAVNDNPSNRTRTGQVDHDVFEGLPVRRWSRQSATISQNTKSESLEGSLLASQKLPELPMPKDSHLLNPMSRALLRAARAGCTYVRSEPRASDDEEKDDKQEGGGNVQVYERTFVSSKWTTIPRHMEPPEMEFLAKRRPGLRSLYGAAVGGAGSGKAGTDQPAVHQPPPMRKTKFRKADPMTGNQIVYEAWVPEGYAVDGEIAPTEEVKPENDESSAPVVPASASPGTVVEGVGVVDQQGIVIAEPDASMVATAPDSQPAKRKAEEVDNEVNKKVKFTPEDGAPATEAEDTPMAGVTGAEGEVKEAQEDHKEVEETGPEEIKPSTDTQPTLSEPAVTVEGQSPEGPSITVTGEAENESNDMVTESETRERGTLGASLAEPTGHLGVPQSSSGLQTPPPRSPEPEAATEPPSLEVNPAPEVEHVDVAVEEVDTEPNPSEQTGPEITVESVVEEPATSGPIPLVSEGAPTTARAPETSPISAPPTTGELPDAPLVAPDSSTPIASTAGADIPTTTVPETEVPPIESAPPETEQKPVHFEDGEVDLLGSLEASLDKRPEPQNEQEEGESLPPPASGQDQDKPPSDSGRSPSAAPVEGGESVSS